MALKKPITINLESTESNRSSRD